jgi:hypothetical protein
MEVLVLRLTMSQEAGQERDKPITVPLQQLKHKRLLARISHENLEDVESLVPAKRIARRVAGVRGMYGCADSLGTREEASNTRGARGGAVRSALDRGRSVSEQDHGSLQVLRLGNEACHHREVGTIEQQL